MIIELPCHMLSSPDESAATVADYVLTLTPLRLIYATPDTLLMRHAAVRGDMRYRYAADVYGYRLRHFSLFCRRA